MLLQLHTLPGYAVRTTLPHQSPIKSTTRPSSGACLPSLAAPNVLIWSAVACSSAFPFLFEPQDLLARDASGNIVKFSGERLCLLILAQCNGPWHCLCGAGPQPQPHLSRTSAGCSHTAVPRVNCARNAGSSTVTETGAAQSQRRWCDGSLEEDLPMRGLG